MVEKHTIPNQLHTVRALERYTGTVRSRREEQKLKNYCAPPLFFLLCKVAGR